MQYEILVKPSSPLQYLALFFVFCTARIYLKTSLYLFMFRGHVNSECISCVYSDSTHLALMSESSDMFGFDVVLYFTHTSFLSTYSFHSYP